MLTVLASDSRGFSAALVKSVHFFDVLLAESLTLSDLGLVPGTFLLLIIFDLLHKREGISSRY